ncbi:MAG TPA: TonB-dependent receptor, partial [Gemmatimonadaceae bacterium]|nr:TonB-dependent receptor [Gemmatimonadaceae bacterium]
VTDSTGRCTLSLAASAGSYQLVVRRIGFERADRFFAASPGTTLRFAVVLPRSIGALAPVTITARESVRQKAYHIGAEEIAHSTRPIVDAVDIVRKLRPDMLTSRMPRACADSGAAPSLTGVGHSVTGGLSNVWVNGTLITMAGVDTTWQQVPGTTAFVRPQVLDILRTIRPEHVESMTYTDCTDTSLSGNYMQNALFITLKPGIAYRYGRGSFVELADVAGDTGAVARTRRVLGVFSLATGAPIAGAEVISLRAGLRARTSVTGTVALDFVPSGTSNVCVQKPGYRDTTFAVTIAAADTVPITLAMAATDTLGPRPHAHRASACAPGARTASLRGLVFDDQSGTGVAGAQASLPALARSATTDSHGVFHLDSLPAGHYLLTIRRLGFTPWQDSVALLAGERTTRVVMLGGTVAVLDTIKVMAARRYISPQLRGFEERRLRAASGYFVSDSVLRQQESLPLADVLRRRIPGINIVESGHGIYLVQSNRCSRLGPAAAGAPDVYVDGVPWPHPAPRAPIDLSQFNVSELAGVEYYPDQNAAPMQYGGTSSACGVLLLWTRER